MNFQLFILRKLKINLMSKNFNPIVVVAGEPKSVFLELFLKVYKTFKKSPIVLIANRRLLIDQQNSLKQKNIINVLDDKNKIDFKKLNNNKINLIDIPFKYHSLGSIKIKESNDYIKRCFDKSIELLKQNKKLKLVNGPIIKKIF